MRLEVTALDRHVIPRAGFADLQGGDHYISIAVEFVDEHGTHRIDGQVFGPATGYGLTPEHFSSWGRQVFPGYLMLADQDGPIVGASGKVGQIQQAFANADWLGVGCSAPSSSGPLDSSPGLGGGAVEAAVPPDRTLSSGQHYGPIRLCYSVKGRTDQHLALIWVPGEVAPTTAPLWISLGT